MGLLILQKDMESGGNDLKHFTLPSGDKIPSVGYGTWKVPKDVLPDCVYNAIKMGYRCIDEAAAYGNEKEAGQGIKKALDEGICKREDLFITSKLWNTYHAPEHVEAACNMFGRSPIRILGHVYHSFPCINQIRPI